MNDLADLVRARKECRLCMSRDPHKIRSGADYDFDPDVVSYWSQWLGHPQPEILIVAQDFGDTGYFERFRGRDQTNNATNNNLRKLLGYAGVEVAEPPAVDPNARVFLTNSVLCLKQPPMNAPISSRWVRACATNHLKPLIRRLKPSIVVGMGSHGWAAVRLALELHDTPGKISLAAGQSWCAGDGCRVFAVGHCGPLGLANRAWELQVEDWKKVGAELAHLHAVFETPSSNA